MRTHTPKTWLNQIQNLCQKQGLSEADAQECITPVLQAYHRCRHAYPWEEPHPCMSLLHRIIRSATAEQWALQQRHQQSSQLVSNCLPPTIMPSPEGTIIDQVMIEQWVATLSPRLQEVVRLRLEGFTCEEIAQQVGVSLGTVLGYLKEVKKKFLKSYPPYPIICASRTDSIDRTFSGGGKEDVSGQQEGQESDEWHPKFCGGGDTFSAGQTRGLKPYSVYSIPR